ncbi:MAG: hypothetical protein KFF68_14410 [Desulfosarcina sp.]|nr:hypothetical protein [Desulfosarcina sp.]
MKNGIYALLENQAKVMENLGRLESLALKTGTDVRVTVHFINPWLAGEAVDVICHYRRSFSGAAIGPPC